MSSNKKKASADLTPRNQSSPFGTLTNTKHSSSYQPNYFDGQQDILNTAPRNEANLLSGDLPSLSHMYTGALGNMNNFMSSLTPDHLVNQQIYDAMYGLNSRPLLNQYHQDVNNLNDELASKNLTGGSYDALAHGKLNQNLGYNLGNAANQAVLSGLQGTTDYAGLLGNNAQLLGQGTQQLGNLASNYQSLHTALEQELMDPFKAYTDYQKTVNPLQLAQFQYDATQPNGFNKAGSIMQAAAPFANFIPGVGPIISAGLQLGGSAMNTFGGNPYAGSGSSSLGKFTP